MIATTVRSDRLPAADHITAAHCLAFDGDRIVLARHVSRGWTIPGGHVEPGETPLAAMRREAREEAGIELGAAQLIANERIDPAPGHDPNPNYPSPGFQLYYAALVTGYGRITATDECTESRLFPPEEALRTPNWPARHRSLYELGREVALTLSQRA
jgi:8-oxo-dGTP pyrophosphatase MutT (NUDIX family)